MATPCPVCGNNLIHLQCWRAKERAVLRGEHPDVRDSIRKRKKERGYPHHVSEPPCADTCHGTNSEAPAGGSAPEAETEVCAPCPVTWGIC